MKHIIAVLLENEPGALSRVVMMSRAWVQCQKRSKPLKIYTRAMFFPLVLALGAHDAADAVADDAE